MSKILKIIDERETQGKKQERKKNRETETVAQGLEINDFVERLS